MAQQDQDERLEQLLGRTVRDLPLRRAPLELELRVLGELERRQASPWWRLSFAHWPFLARGGLIALCCTSRPWLLRRLPPGWSNGPFR
jgi:hypothetical protein